MQASTSAKEAWASTHLMTSMATRLVGSEKYLGRDDRQLGTLVGEHAYELFSIGPPDEALQLYFQQQQPTFIAVHDVGGMASAPFLQELATALQQPAQTLTIRQQGTGVTTAVLRFIELPSPQGNVVRVYATSVEADTVARKLVGEALLAFSRLGVLLVDAQPDHMLGAKFTALRERLLSVPWTNQELLIVPRAHLPTLREHAQRMVDGTLVRVGTAAPAVQTAGVWNAIHGAWSRPRSAAADHPVSAPAMPAPAVSARTVAPPPPPAPPAAAASAPAFLRAFGAPPKSAGPAPAPAAQRPAPAPAQNLAPAPVRTAPPAQAYQPPAPAPVPGVEAYARACSALHGALNCVVFDRISRRPIEQAGRETMSAAMVSHIATSIDAAQAMNAAWGGTSGVVETVSTLDRQVVVSRTLARRPGLGMAIAFDKAQANLMLLRAQLQRLDAMLDQ